MHLLSHRDQCLEIARSASQATRGYGGNNQLALTLEKKRQAQLASVLEGLAARRDRAGTALERYTRVLQSAQSATRQALNYSKLSLSKQMAEMLE